MKQIIFLFIMTVCFLACGGDDPEGCQPKNVASLSAQTLIENYIVDNGLSPELNNQGLYYTITNPGSAEKPTLADVVTVTYKGYYRNDCEFDSNNNIAFGLTGLIEAWQIGIPLLGKGGSMMMIVHPDLGYGPNPPQGIKAGEPLIFDIELIDF